MQEVEGDLERLCQAVSPNDEPCDYPATVHCAKCERWFCDAHAEDQEWHPCMLPQVDCARYRGAVRQYKQREPARFAEELPISAAPLLCLRRESSVVSCGNRLQYKESTR